METAYRKITNKEIANRKTIDRIIMRGKQISFSFCLLLFCLLPVERIIAQADTLILGYSDGQLATTGTIGTAGAKWVHAAVHFPAEKLKGYNGNQITTVKAGLTSKLNIDTLTVWIRTTLDGENLVQGSINKDNAPKIVKGWNEIKLDAPYTIPSATGLYIGYSYKQKGSSFGISCVGQPQTGGFYAKLGNDALWEDHSNQGVLSLEALVSGDHLPQYDLTLTTASTKANYVIGSPMQVALTVRNLAACTINGFDVTCKIENSDSHTSHVNCRLAYNEQDVFYIEFVPALTEVAYNREMTVTISKLDEGEDINPYNNNDTLNFDVIRHEYVRNILIEEFTTEKCQNCPNAAQMLHTAIEEMTAEHGDRFIAVCHHSGYYEDWLTTPADNYYLWLFNAGGSTYAPAFMIDRYTFKGTTPVFDQGGGVKGLKDYMKKRLETPSYVYMEMEAECSENNDSVTIKVKGDRSRQFSTVPPRITVYAVENNIPAQSQAGAGKDYIQQHVLRAYNSIWGDEIVWNDNTFEYTCTLKLRGNWKKENMELIAFVNSYDNTNANNCHIENTCKTTLPYHIIDNIGSTVTDSPINVYVQEHTICIEGNYNSFTLYCANGQEVYPGKNLENGLYIIRISTDSGIVCRKAIICK